jgi:hypothetical protein
MDYPQQQQLGELAPQNPYYYDQMQPNKIIPINTNNDFMQWLFNFKDQVVTPLVHIWRGEEEDGNGNWIKHNDGLVIMNEKGITWCSSFISSFINPVYVVSNYDENNMNWTMRKVGRITINSLCRRYEEFELKKIDIPRVSIEIVSKVHAILLGARGDGFRMFFTKTHHIEEVKTRNEQQQGSRWTGFGLFKKPNIAQQSATFGMEN